MGLPFAFWINPIVLPISYLLDDYTGAAAAYSLRSLKSITTNVIKVRRSSDNTEQDFTAAEITDGTLTTFTGSGDGFVSVWYDQSENSVDLSNATASFQKRIVNTGVLNVDNGKPYLEYLGTDTQGLFNVSSGLNSSNGTIYMTYNSSDSNGMLITASLLVFIGVIQNSSSSGLIDLGAGNPTYNANGSLITQNNRDDLHTSYATGQDVLATIENADFSSPGKWNTIRPFVYVQSVFTGTSKVKEIIIYNSDKSSDSAGIESNINAEYTIY